MKKINFRKPITPISGSHMHGKENQNACFMCILMRVGGKIHTRKEKGKKKKKVPSKKKKKVTCVVGDTARGGDEPGRAQLGS